MSITRTIAVTQQAHRLIESEYAVLRTGEEDANANSQPNRVLPTHILDSSANSTVAQLPSNDERIDPSTAPHPRVSGVVSPQWWPSDRWRRVPEYAPINYELDMIERPTGENSIIGFLLMTTFSGCHILTVYSSVWRGLTGRHGDKYWRYEVGGEF